MNFSHNFKRVSKKQRKMMRLQAALCICGICAWPLFTIAGNTPSQGSFQQQADIQAEVNFLTGSLLTKGDGGFQTIEGMQPLSYLSNNINYWGNYVCGQGQGQDACAVEDKVYEDPYAIAPVDPKSQGGRFQEERAFNTQGADIYDAATWQIAVALAAQKGFLSSAMAETLIDNQNLRLDKFASRASAAPKTGFIYGYDNGPNQKEHIENLKYAYALRMFGPSFAVNDPFKGTGYAAHVTGPKEGQITWADWKPITGENAWAFLIGGLQAADLLAKGEPLSVDNLALQHALDFLWPLQRMQSPIGAFYYATKGSMGNTGEPVPDGEISAENNASLLGGLNILQKNIEAIPGWQSHSQLNAAHNAINIMIYGGSMPQNGGHTAGLLNYFKNQAWDVKNGVFYQGGIYHDGQWTPTREPFALDVNTWGVLALGPKTIDGRWGPGTAFQIWEKSRQRAGYFAPDGTLWGVGYTDQSHDPEKVLSGEWTAGAINMVRVLRQYYQSSPGLNTQQMTALQRDQQTMEAGLLKLRTDNYSGSDFQKGVNAQFLAKVANSEKGIFYASRRYYIPFGWYANPMPSSASTSWTVMLSEGFSPLSYQGSMQSNDFSSTPPYQKEQYQLSIAQPGSVTVLNQIVDQATGDMLAPIAVSYSTSAQPGHWVEITKINNGSWKNIVIPPEAQTLSIAFRALNDGQWYGACRLAVTPDLRSKLMDDPLHTGIVARWAGTDGTGECPLLKAITD